MNVGHAFVPPGGSPGNWWCASVILLDEDGSIYYCALSPGHPIHHQRADDLEGEA